MKTSAPFLAAGLCCLTAQAGSDFLRFENGDQLSGRFLGVTGNGEIRLQSAEMKQPAEFRVDSVRHLVLNGGKPQQAEESLGHLGLTNGDRIPGRVTAIDDTHITLETKFAGTLRAPKDHVSLLASNPFGGRIHYYGPFSDDGWKLRRDKPEDKATPENKEKQPWEFSGSAWYWNNKSTPTGNPSSLALTRSEGMSDRSTLRFRVDWKDRVALSVAFHADFATGAPGPAPEAKADDQELRREQSSIPSIFGNCYVLQIQSSYMMLYRSSWNPQTGSRFERIQMNSNYVRLSEDRSATFEIRSNRTNGHIALFLNDEFSAQWTEPVGNEPEAEGFAGKGNGFGFLAQAGSGTMRVSEISVSEWNGMPDSARSMEVDDKDVVLMTNGTDRFAGKILGMEGTESIRFESRHGMIVLPLTEIAEIRFARSHLAKSESQKGPALHLGPVGRLTAKSITGDDKLLKLEHAILGPVELHTEPLIMIEYKSGTRIADEWNEDL